MDCVKSALNKSRIVILTFCLTFLVFSSACSAITQNKKEEIEEDIIWKGVERFQRCRQAPIIISNIRERLRESPDDERLLSQMAFVADYCGLWYVSIEANTKLIEIGESNSAEYNNLGRAYMNLGNLDKAERYLKQSLEIEPDNFFAFNNLGLLFKYKGDYEGSVQHFKRALEISPNWPQTHYDFGNTYLVMKDYERAIQCYKEAMELGLKDGDVFKNLGLAYLGKGDKRQALNYFKKALNLSPEDQELKDLFQMTKEAIKKKEKLEITSE